MLISYESGRGKGVEQIRWWYRAWRYRLKLERYEIRLLRARLRPGDAALDIGAHKGAMTWWMRVAVGREGSVDAFEPQPQLAQRLQALTRSDHWQNVRVFNQGVSEHAVELSLHVPAGGPSPGASFNQPGDPNVAVDTLKIPVTTVDTWQEAHARTPLRLIKCDVEGHELAVFRGATRTLAEQRPALLFECEQRHQPQQDMREVFHYLQDQGYEGFCIAAKTLIPVSDFDPNIYQNPDGPFGYLNNFWFTHPAHA